MVRFEQKSPMAEFVPTMSCDSPRERRMYLGISYRDGCDPQEKLQNTPGIFKR